ncbi:hypothetical protein V3C99_000278 [Haemonchus contortus]
MHFLLLIVLVIEAIAQNSTEIENPLANFTLTIDMVNEVIERLKTESQFIPSYILQPIVTATDQEKQQFVEFANNLLQGKYKSADVTSLAQLLQLLQSRAPLVYQKGLVIYKAFMDKVYSLNPEAEAFVIKWMNKWAETIKAMPTGNALQLSFDFNKQFFNDAKKLTPEAVESLKKQFPEFARLWETCPQLQQFANFVANAPDNIDVMKLEAMQEYMGNFNGTAQVPVNVQN